MTHSAVYRCRLNKCKTLYWVIALQGRVITGICLLYRADNMLMLGAGRSCCSRGRRTPRSGSSAWPRTPTRSSCCGAPWWTRCTRWRLAGGSLGWCAVSHMLGGEDCFLGFKPYF